MSWLMWFCQLLRLQLFLFHSLSSSNLCSHDQSFALLHFKRNFFFNDFATSHCNRQLHYPKMKYWKEDIDCCSWDGVTCDMVTGDVIGLDLSYSCLSGSIPSNTSLFLLSRLQKLNLAFNDFNLSQIPSDFVTFPSLTHLDLSSSHFSGQVPFQISHLSKLISLDLSGNDLTLETLVMKRLIQNMTQLEELNLEGVKMSSLPSSLTNLSSSLTLLILNGCGLQGSFPVNIFHLPNLHTLDLSSNRQLTGTFPKVNWSSPLRYLDVSVTQFSGELPDAIGNLNSLSSLYMERCDFIGSIPASIGNLMQLSSLSLLDNAFSAHIPSSLSNLELLIKLDLSVNNLSGEILDVFTNLTQLCIIDFSKNSLFGPIPYSLVSGLPNLGTLFLNENSLDGTIPLERFTLPPLDSINLSNNQLTSHIEFHCNSLSKVDLSNNRFHGPFPSSIFELVNLTSLDLSFNHLSGTVEISMFAKLKYLEDLDLSYNSLLMSTTIKVNSSFPNLVWLDLSSCNINEFPEILSTADNLQWVHLSDNKIHGNIPNWLFNIGPFSLNLSHNFLTSIEQLPWKGLLYLDLHSNLLQGLLPDPPPQLYFFSVSHNNMTGAIPSSFCNLSSIVYLLLSNNSLYGTVPQCLGNYTTIFVLDLRINNFHGNIPLTFANGSRLTTLNLNGNRFEGSLPPSLVNCVNLEVLDLGNNMINDTFPHWLAALPELQVLILRSNRFYGPLGNSRTRIPFSKLRILDLSHNGFTGPLRTMLFKNLKAMMSGKNNSAEITYMKQGGYYFDSVIVTMKGVDIEMQRILTIFTTIDLSSNKFQGQIPDVVGKLNSLILLNYSHNILIGHIPLSLKNLTELESLDLSSNRLEGKIPMQLTSLTSLSVLNFSYNQLAGPIPHGKQFNTFENNSYFGNLGLCGDPLSEKCGNVEPPESKPIFHDEQDNSSWFDWKIIMMGYGSGLVIGLSMGYIVFSTRKPW